MINWSITTAEHEELSRLLQAHCIVQWNNRKTTFQCAYPIVNSSKFEVWMDVLKLCNNFKPLKKQKKSWKNSLNAKILLPEFQ